MPLALPLSFPLHVAGTVVHDGPRADVNDPWRGDKVGDVVLADAAQADRAAAAAVQAFAETRRLPAFEKKKILRNIAAAVATDAEGFAELIAREAAKPIALARGEVKRAIATLELGAEEATRVGGEVLPIDVSEVASGYAGGYARVPSGPVIAMAPFNFPLNLVCHKVAPALAAGCSIVLKPPPQAPLTALRLAAIVRESGAPPNTLQVLPCPVDVAENLVRDTRFRVLSFTGSARVGWHLRGLADKKRVLLELGGNASIIVHEDADLGWAVGRTFTSSFAYAGQVCIKTQRLYVHASVYDGVVGELQKRTSELSPRDPLDPSALMSSLIDESNAIRVKSWVDKAQAFGARLLAGGARDGTRVSPTLIAIDGAGTGLEIVDEEVFGPVLTVHRYEEFDQALAWAGGGRYGLQAGLFTQHLGRIREAFASLDVGGLVVNDSPSFRVDSMPYGGVRDSGLGREGVRFAVEEMTEPKLLVLRG